MSGIFVSYRRDDASGWAGRLYEHLAREWGPDRVFMDIDAIAPGEDFRQAIARTIETCDVVLVVIGPNWLTILDEAGHRRLENETDTHRAEVVAALAGDVRVIPVLVGGAAMPAVAELPEPLRELAYRNAARVDDRRFSSDVEMLQRALRQQVRHVTGNTAGHGSGSPASPANRMDRGSPEASPTPADPPGLSVPKTLVVAGALLVAVWGVLVQRPWHNELWWIRAGAGVLLIAFVIIGLRARRWRDVLVAGVAGLLGFTVWLGALVSTHARELPELFGFAHDGLWNALTIGGAVLVAVGGWVGTRVPDAKKDNVDECI